MITIYVCLFENRRGREDGSKLGAYTDEEDTRHSHTLIFCGEVWQ